MVLVSLHKEKNLTELLKEYGLHDRQESVQSELPFYDEYYLSPTRSFIKVWNQKFVSDPYIKSKNLRAAKIVNYSGSMEQDDIDDKALKSDVPVIVRVPVTQTLSGFYPLLNTDGQETLLIPIKLSIPHFALPINDHVRQMTDNDLRKVKNMLQNEYSLRYRAVPLLWKDSDESSFVYDDEGIGGFCFNNVIQDEVYMRQLFVPKSHRGQGIGKALYQSILKFGQEKRLRTLRANVRNEAKLFYRRFGAHEDVTQPLQWYLISEDLR